MEQLKIEYLPLSDIKPYKRNAKRHPREQIEQIKKSITDFGMNDPIAIWKQGEIIEGHGRYIACKELGIDPVPVIRLDGLTDEQRRAYMLVHNKLTMNSDFDLELLNSELDTILDIDMDFFGFGDEEEGEEKDPEPHEDGYDIDLATPEPNAKAGEVWRLGEHRLMCGDSTKAEDVEKLMGGELADLVVTDPPYGVSYADKNAFLNAIAPGNRIQEKIENDHKTAPEMGGFWERAFQNAAANTKQKMAYYIFGPQGGDLLTLLQAVRSSGLQLKHVLVWVKNNHVLGRADYNYKHEPIVYGWKPDGTHSFYGGFDTSVFESPLDVNSMKKEEMAALLKQLLSEAFPTDVIHENKPQKSDLHPTMKPIKLLARLIANSSRPGELILDLFGGSGSTLIACEQLGRRCCMMEYDPHYCDVIIDRWEQATGRKAEKIKE